MTKGTKTTLLLGAISFALLTTNAHGQSVDSLINKLLQKGVLTEKEAADLKKEASDTNFVSASKWKLSDSIKNINLYGDVRFRYEYRSAENAPAYTLAPGNAYFRERFRYAVRFGIRGDLFDNFYYGLRLETSANPRSPWVTFGDDSNGTPSAKNSDGINIGQAFVGWRPADWFEATVGKMPMPLYVTPMIWDADISPEGAVEKFKYSVGNVDLFANFGQFMYQDTDPDHDLPSSDTFLLAWQVGANVKFDKNLSLKVAPVIYNYAGRGAGNGLNITFSGQGAANGGNIGYTNNGAAFNQKGINNLLVLEVPAELNLNFSNQIGRA